jgi:hypothetical protein
MNEFEILLGYGIFAYVLGFTIAWAFKPKKEDRKFKCVCCGRRISTGKYCIKHILGCDGVERK